MATVPKSHWALHWPHKAKTAQRDPAAEQLRRDRMTAFVIVGIMLVIFAVIATLAAISGGPAGEMIDPWIMP